MPPATNKDEHIYPSSDLVLPFDKNLIVYLFHNPKNANKNLQFGFEPRKGVDISFYYIPDNV